MGKQQKKHSKGRLDRYYYLKEKGIEHVHHLKSFKLMKNMAIFRKIQSCH